MRSSKSSGTIGSTPLNAFLITTFRRGRPSRLFERSHSAKLLEIQQPLLLLDEPTAGLSREETAFFFESIRNIAHRAAVIFVSHRLSELLELSNRIYVFKDGEVVAEPDPAACAESELHFLMVGRKRDSALYQETLQRPASSNVALN